jgi:thiol-disulfide isomerase/thioredoxin
MSEDVNQEPRRFTIPANELGAFDPADIEFTLAVPADSPPIKDESTEQVRRIPLAAGEVPLASELRSLGNATAWLNSQPLTAADLREHVIFVDFWTYTCVNWLRTLPYLRAWDAAYRDAGLTIVGVHTPEFGFERDLDNIADRARAFGVGYPIAIDGDYGVWRAFANHYWPAAYLADAEGRIRFHHFGEGEYAMTEMAIQRLLLEAGAVDVDEDLAMVDPRGLEVAADWRTLQSPETYTGYGQAAGFASEESSAFDRPHAYSASARLPLNAWDLDGTWTVTRHAAVSGDPTARIVFQFHARDLNLVMGPAAKGAAVPFRVSLAGRPPGEAHGTDVDADGRGTLDAQRTYQLIRQPGQIADRRFEIEFDEAGAEAHCFTFG